MSEKSNQRSQFHNSSTGSRPRPIRDVLRRVNSLNFCKNIVSNWWVLTGDIACLLLLLVRKSVSWHKMRFVFLFFREVHPVISIIYFPDALAARGRILFDENRAVAARALL